MKPSYVYFGCCVNLNGRKIEDMVDRAREIIWKTFKNYVSPQDVKELFPDYKVSAHDTGFMHIEHDYSVSFHKSTYNGKPCVFLVHSAIEYVFM